MVYSAACVGEVRCCGAEGLPNSFVLKLLAYRCNAVRDAGLLLWMAFPLEENNIHHVL